MGGSRDGINYTDRRPTTEEYNQWLGQTRAWMASSLRAAFNNNDASTATFVGLHNVLLENKSFNTASANPTFTHSLTVTLDMKFRVGAGQSVPYMYTWVSALRNAGLTNYRESYLYNLPSTNVFQGVRSVQWAALDP